MPQRLANATNQGLASTLPEDASCHTRASTPLWTPHRVETMSQRTLGAEGGDGDSLSQRTRRWNKRRASVSVCYKSSKGFLRISTCGNVLGKRAVPADLRAPQSVSDRVRMAHPETPSPSWRGPP